MKKLTLKQAAEDCHGTLAPEQAEAVVTGVQIDSRRVKPGDLFIAIKGEKVEAECWNTAHHPAYFPAARWNHRQNSFL